MHVSFLAYKMGITMIYMAYLHKDERVNVFEVLRTAPGSEEAPLSLCGHSVESRPNQRG